MENYNQWIIIIDTYKDDDDDDEYLWFMDNNAIWPNNKKTV